MVVTIDLDYFAGMAPAAQASEFERVWRFVSERRNLRAVTFAISRPYFTDDAESHRLVELAIKGAISLPTATIQFEPFAPVAEDHSKQAGDSPRPWKACSCLRYRKGTPGTSSGSSGESQAIHRGIRYGPLGTIDQIMAGCGAMVPYRASRLRPIDRWHLARAGIGCTGCRIKIRGFGYSGKRGMDCNAPPLSKLQSCLRTRQRGSVRHQ